MSAVPMLEFEDVSFAFDTRPVLSNLSLTLQAGASAALIGPNGAGKTTLLRLAIGALTPTSGRVLLNGKPLSSLNRRQRAQTVALVPQLLTVPFDFTVEQIVGHGRSPYLGFLHGPRHADRQAVDRALALTDLSSMRGRIVNELSGGERQRVKIALGLAQSTQILLLDEPAQNLDIGRQSELLDLLDSLHAEGLTMLTSLHDLHLIAGHFADVHLLSADRTHQHGTPAHILTASNISQAFRCSVRAASLSRQPTLGAINTAT